MNTQRRIVWQSMLLAAVAPGVWAQSPQPWPSRPIRIIAGGAASVTDIRARWIAPRLAQALGQPVVVENVPAAGGTVAAAETARSAPDGYTVLVYHQGIAAINPHLYAKPGYDPLRDLVGITRFGHGAQLLTVPAALPVRSVADLVALAREKPGALNFGSPGNGTPPHLASEMFVRMTGIQATHVPYRGGAPLMTAMLGGQVSWTIEGMTAQLPHVRSGALRALAVTGARRSSALPDVPTMAETGVTGYEYEGWTGFAVAAATPRPIVERLHSEVARIAATAEARDWLLNAGAEAGILTLAEMAVFVQREHARFGQFIRETGLKAE
jgi:tripartite-type tricarboxylate transporter receptor subunit TctC